MEGSYKKLAVTIAINSVVMFLLTYVMIDSLNHFLVNINKVYMTLMMVAPMVVLMLLIMGAMYKNKKLNYVLIVVFLALFAGVFWLARTQTLVGNEQFLRSMIPHHSSAILMCEESAITDPEILSMCDEIVSTQREEIAQMEDILARLGQ